MADTAETEVASMSAAFVAAAAGAPSDATTPPHHNLTPTPTTATTASSITPPEASRPGALSPEPAFPPLHNSAGADTESITSAPSSRAGLAASARAARDMDDDEPGVAKPFQRTSSPDPPSRPGHAKVVDDNDDGDNDNDGGSRPGGSSADGPAHPRPRPRHQQMHRYSLYETASRFYIVGGDVTEKRYRILKIDRTGGDDGDDGAAELSITDDKTVYSQKDMNQLLDTIDDGNKGTGGLRLRCTTWGLLGFIKFTGPYYMLLITKKSTVAMIGGHYVYQIDGTDLVPLTSPASKPDQRNTDETRFLSILGQLDLTRSFYYSYSYDLTHTLQHNTIREREALLAGGRPGTAPAEHDFNSMFIWNNHLLQPAAKVLNAPFDWCRPIIHGYIDQAAVSVYGRTAHITVIARRSRCFAGARFLKRGANDLGYVANDVETEQIVSEAMTTSFHAPGPKFFANPTYTSYVQHRGSIPLHWTQDNTGVTPKPPIELNLVDPFYTAAALHFDNLFERYGAPIYALNLIKARERTPRESKLLEEYTRAIEYLNQFLPPGKKIIHKAWDMSRAAKSRDQDVIGTLESIAEEVVRTTGFFQNGDGHTTPIRVQNGVARTNCIDCLDRTNAAQFVIGKRALGHQLHALGILGDTSVEYDTDAVNLFTHMYHDHGDTIAMQYGGSQLVNTMETYRKINQWTSHSRDMVESFKRYYNNSFLDGQRQEAYNLFLGNYIFAQGQPMLWDLATDYYLHHEDPRTWLEKGKRDYIHWYTPEFLKERVLPPYPQATPGVNGKPISAYDDYWLEYYRPSTLSSFPKMFPYKMNSTIKYIPFKSTQDGRYDLSPFRVRNEAESAAQERKKAKKEVTIMAPQDLARMADDTETSSVNEKSSSTSTSAAANNRMSLPRWLHGETPANGAQQNGQHHHATYSHSRNNSADDPSTLPYPAVRHTTHQIHHARTHSYPQAHHHHHHTHHRPHASITSLQTTDKPHQSALEKSRAAQQTFTQVVHDSLNPAVSAAEAADYARYVAHPHNLPLVGSSSAAVAAAATGPGGTVAMALASAAREKEDGEEEVEPEYLEFVNGGWREEGLGRAVDFGEVNGGVGNGVRHGGVTNVGGGGEEDRLLYVETVKVAENPLTVTEEDAQKKRYKAYRKWLRGKSLFKQQPVD